MTTYRGISLDGLQPATARDQALPILQWVDLADLVIDDRYQRPLGVRNLTAIQKIADGFDWMQFSPVLLAPADAGRFAVIDGQHRVHAAALCGIAKVLAQIVLASASEQAKAFAGVNGRVSPITGHQVYRAALVAGEGWAERCRDVVEAAGCQLATYNPTAKLRKPRVIYQVGTVRKMIVDRKQAEALSCVLAALAAYDKTGRVGLYTDYIVGPLVAAAHSFGATQASVAHWAEFLRARDPFHVLDAAMKRRAAGGVVSNINAFRAAYSEWVYRP